jgi:hypothetical protein
MSTRKEAHPATDGVSEQHVKLVAYRRHADGTWSATYKLTGTILMPDGREIRTRRRFHAKGRLVKRRGRLSLAKN